MFQICILQNITRISIMVGMKRMHSGPLMNLPMMFGIVTSKNSLNRFVLHLK